MERRRFMPGVVALIAGVVVFALAMPALASAQMPASGTETYFPNFALEKVADGNLFFSALNPGFKTGTFSGTQLSEFTLVGFKDGSFIFHGIQTFTGTVAGCGTGTVVFRIEGAGFVGPAGEMITRSHQQTLFGEGTLPVHASLDSLGVGTTLTYTGEYHC